jgi:hypothetical protein
MAKQPKTPVLEESLLAALGAIDNQIRRAMERSPKEREIYGVQKWKPYDDRIEKICTFLLSNYGEKFELDSLLVILRSSMKTLGILCEELGTEGMGEMRSAYIKETLEQVSIELERAKGTFKRDEPSLM